MNKKEKELFDLAIVKAYSVMDKLNAPYDCDYSIRINPNFRNHTLGRCNYKKHEITINKTLLLDEHMLVQTIIHELLHSGCPKSGHTGTWKKHAQLITSKTNYVITRTTRCSSIVEKAMDKKKKANPYKYEVYCPNCDANWKYKSKSKAVLHPKLFICRRCRSDLKSRVL